jgi:hypothetical protein
LGVIASVSYGVWGFLEKLTSAQSPAVVNVVVYGTAFLLSLSGLTQFRPPSFTAIIAGVAGGAINALILLLLQRHALTLVYPFVSCGSLVFIAFSFFFVDGQLVVRSRATFWGGVAIAVIGLILCGVDLAGGVTVVRAATADMTAVYIGVLITVLTGMWLFLAFITITRQRYPPLIASTWVFLGSFGASLAVAMITDVHARDLLAAPSMIAIGAGSFMFGGELATYFGFSVAPTLSNRGEQVLTALLANSELVPILAVSALVFNDVSILGTAGAALVIAGIGVSNHARV